MEGMERHRSSSGWGQRLGHPPDTATLGHLNAVTRGARWQLRARREEPSREKIPRFTEGFLISLSLEGKPRKKHHLGGGGGTNTHKYDVSVFLSPAAQSGGARVLRSLGWGCGVGGKVGGKRARGLHGELLPQFLPIELNSFKFPPANSSGDKKRGACPLLPGSPWSSAEHPSPLRGTRHLRGDEDRDPTPCSTLDPSRPNSYGA